MKRKFVDFVHYIYFFLNYFFLKDSVSYFSNIQNGDIVILNKIEQKIDIPKIIWIFWYDDNIPELVQLCIDKIKKLHKNYEINILNKKNISEYIDMNIDLLVEKMPIANLSDLIRLKLLKKYGGVWLDASIILEEAIDDFFLEKNNSFDIVAYYNESQSTGCNIPVIESWLLAAPKDSDFINKWLFYFQPIEVKGSKEFYQQWREHENFDELSKGLGDPSYLLVYMAAKLALDDLKNKSNILLHCCDDSAFSIQILSQWRTRKCVTNFYMKDVAISSPIYKLTNGDRKYFSFLRKYNLIKEKSIIGLLLKKDNSK